MNERSKWHDVYDMQWLQSDVWQPKTMNTTVLLINLMTNMATKLRTDQLEDGKWSEETEKFTTKVSNVSNNLLFPIEWMCR